MSASSLRRGFSRWDLLVVVLTFLTFFAIALPVIRQHREDSKLNESMANLLTLSISHTMYAADHNGNQWALVPQDLGTYGDTMTNAVAVYHKSLLGSSDFLGDVVFFSGKFGVEAGWACSESTGCAKWFITSTTGAMPISLSADVGGGHFRWHPVKSFNTYVNGAFYDPTFYAPKDAVAIANAGECFGSPEEFCVDNTGAFSVGSYALSPAAMYQPEMWAAGEGQFPQSNNEVFASWPMAFKSPSFSQIGYPDLKTHMIEHHWLQNVPKGLDPCHPELSSPGFCAPWRFNHSTRSEPVALFYDGHVRVLPNMEVMTHERHLKLWRRDTATGLNGYGLDLAHDDFVDVSHHILTIDGGRGRDTLGPLPWR